MQNSTSKFHNFSFQSSKLAFYHFSLLSFNPPQCSHLLTFHLLLSLTCPKTMLFWPKFRIDYFTTEASLVRIVMYYNYFECSIENQNPPLPIFFNHFGKIWVISHMGYDTFTTLMIYVVHMSWKWVFNSS